MNITKPRAEDVEQKPTVRVAALGVVVAERVDRRAEEREDAAFRACLNQRVIAEDEADDDAEHEDIDGEKAACLPPAIERHMGVPCLGNALRIPVWFLRVRQYFCVRCNDASVEKQ